MMIKFQKKIIKKDAERKTTVGVEPFFTRTQNIYAHNGFS